MEKFYLEILKTNRKLCQLLKMYNSWANQLQEELKLWQLFSIKKLKQDIAKCKHFSLQFDESNDVVDIVQLCIYTSIRISFTDMTSKEDLLTILPLKGKTRG